MRNLFLALRRLMPSEEKQKADRIISDKLLALPEWQKAETVCLYFSRLEEVDTKSLLAAALIEEKQVVFPRIEAGKLFLHKITSTKDFTSSSYHILEPKKSTPIVDPKSVDLYIVPGVAFDRNMNRLGWGKGYYDSLLQNISAPKIGLAYAIQVVAQLPRSSYDVPMTMIITEEEIICQ